MSKLPVIVGYGGINAAGRSSAHHAYRRMVIDVIKESNANDTYRSLATLMNLRRRSSDEASADILDNSLREYIDGHTLVRGIGDNLFNPDHIRWNRRMEVSPQGPHAPIEFITKAKSLPHEIPEQWQLSPLDGKRVKVTIPTDVDVLLPTYRRSKVKAAGQLPTGFDPKLLYPSRNHPRGIQMTIFGASDALGSIGIEWDQIKQSVKPDQISVYAGSGMSQLDINGNGGMMMARMIGKKVTSKQCPFGFAEMPADFINAYVLGSVGNTGTAMGACASFLYNMRMGLMDIQTGRARVAIVGNSEAPITPEIIEGYAAMGALATDQELLALDEALNLDVPDYRRACRPFSSNCGFTLAESAQFIVLMDDDLALELGASIHGAVSDVFVNADGFKKSISSPGVGNYITMAKALAAGRAIVGEEAIRKRSFVQAHGTGTPQNRVTESHILNEVAKTFGIESWPVAAVKSYLGHSIGVAGGDQIINTLGIWCFGWIPGIATIDHVAEDVEHSQLSIGNKHVEVGTDGMDVSIINAKGFGGNNASATLLAPHVIRRMLAKKHGAVAMKTYLEKNESVRETALEHDKAMTAGNVEPIYRFNHNVLEGEDIEFDDRTLQVPGYGQAVDLDVESPYQDML